MTLQLPSPIVTAEWLKGHLGHPDLIVLDANVPYGPAGPDGKLGLAQWRTEHLPGSVYAELQTRLSDINSPFGFTYPGDDAFAAAIQSLGVHDGSTVVVYDDFLNMWSTRVWLMLQAIGFKAVAVLDGGMKAWRAAGYRLEAGGNTLTPSRGTLTVSGKRVFADTDAVSRLLTSPGQDRSLVCALPEAYYSGAEPVNGRGGHIPGSHNLPASTLLNDSGTFLPVGELRSKLDALLKADEVMLYCGGGISATLVAFALFLAGRDDVLVYDGSLEEWNSDLSRPIVSMVSR